MSTALPIAAAAVGAIGQVTQGFAARRAANANARATEAQGRAIRAAAEADAQQGELNAQLAEAEAGYLSRIAVHNERQVRERAETIQAENRALIGASGVLFEGSPENVLMANAMEIEDMALGLRLESARQAVALRQEARLARHGAALDRYRGDLGLAGAQRDAALQRFAGRAALAQSFGAAGTTAAGSLLAGASAQRNISQQAELLAELRR